MFHHPPQFQVEIVGLYEHGRGRSCDEHVTCGSILQIDHVVRLRSIQIINGEQDRELYCFIFYSNTILSLQTKEKKKPQLLFTGLRTASTDAVLAFFRGFAYIIRQCTKGRSYKW